MNLGYRSTVLATGFAALSVATGMSADAGAQGVGRPSVAETASLEAHTALAVAQSDRQRPNDRPANRLVTVRFEQVSIRDALQEITRQSGLVLRYKQDVLPTDFVTFTGRKISALDAVRIVLQGRPVSIFVESTGAVTLARNNSNSGSARAEKGIVSGVITDAASKQAIPGVSISIGGIQLSTVTDEKGTFRIPGIVPGSHTITIKRIGYQTVTRRVEVSEGGTVTVDVSLTAAVSVLNEVVTTATGDRSRLEVGNAIGTIKADSVVRSTLIRNVSDLLTARTPGVIVSNTSGLVGAPSKIRVRGVGSIQLNNDPIVVIDGVRMPSQTTTANSQTNTGYAFQGSGQILNGAISNPRYAAPSRLDDIDPSTIESIDVLRGPSAASLYGTEAANGVIVIKTKKGSAGRFRLNLLGDHGWSYRASEAPLMWFGWGRRADGVVVNNCMLTRGTGVSAPTVSDGSCIQDSVTAYNPQNIPDFNTLGTGHTNTFATNLSGGTDQLRQFVSVRYSDNIGMAKLSSVEARRLQRMRGIEVPSWIRRPNTEKNVNGTSRTDIQVGNKLDLAFNANAVYRDVMLGHAGMPLSAVTGFDGGSFLSVPQANDTLRYLPAETQGPRRASLSKRAYGSLLGTYNAVQWLSLRSTIGADYTLRTDQETLREVDCTQELNPTGCPSVFSNAKNETFMPTADFSANLSFHPFDWLSTRTAFGEQLSRTYFESIRVANARNTKLSFGTEMLSPIASNNTTQLFEVSHTRDEAATAGWYVEQTLSALERIFLTAGFRQDAASSFGVSVNKSGLPVYPKVSASWLLSNEPMFPVIPTLSNLRLRLAYGHSGTQARQNDVLRNFMQTNTLSGTEVVSGIHLSSIGNPSLKPERTTEWEGGFDLSLLENDRVTFEATMYRKLSKDAIMQIRLPNSLGIAGLNYLQYTGLDQRANIGSVENKGTELSLMARIIELPQLEWAVTINRTQNRNKLVKKSITTGAGSNLSGRFVEGYPIFGYWGQRLISYHDLNNDGILSLDEAAFTDSVQFLGAAYPRSEMSYSNAVSLFNGLLRMNANFAYTHRLSTQLLFTSSSRIGARCMYDPTCTLAQQAVILESNMGTGGANVHETSTLRFSEFSLTYTLPQRLVRQYARGTSMSVTVAGRNLGLWTNYLGEDPNVRAPRGIDGGTMREGTVDSGNGIAQPRNWMVRFNLGL